MKKSQITVFILIVILLILILFFSYNYFTNIENNINEVNPQFIESSVKYYFEDCMLNNLDEIISYISFKGGYFGYMENFVIYPLNSLNTDLIFPIYINNSEKLYLNKERLDEEIKFGIYSSLDQCSNFSIFPYNISYDFSLFSLDLILLNDSIILELFYPIIIETKNYEVRLDSFYLRKETKINNLYTIAKKITNLQSSYENEICETCILNLLNEEIYLSSLEYFSNETYVIIYSLEDKHDNLIFNFAHFFDIDLMEDLD